MYRFFWFFSSSLFSLFPAVARAACDATCTGNSGSVLTTLDGVSVFSNGSCTGSCNGDYQCVELVKRFHGISPGIYYASDYFTDLPAGNSNFTSYANGGTTGPQTGDILVFSGGGFGHVGLVGEVGSNYVMLVDQNRTSSASNDPYRLSLSIQDSHYSLGSFDNDYTVIGWVRSSSYTPSSEASLAIQSKADELWGIRPSGSSLMCGDQLSGLICEETEGGNMHWYEGVTNSYVIETWHNGTWGDVALTYDPDTNSCHEAFVLRHGFWEEYQLYGPDAWGAPLGDEMDSTREDEYSAYDPYCTGQQGYAEPEGCIEEFCGSSRTYTSVQRFENVTLCWNQETEEVECDPTWFNPACYMSVSATEGSTPSEDDLLVYNGSIYWVHNGYTHGIVSSEMFEACGFSWSDPYPVSEDVFNSLPQGDTVHDPVSCGAVQDGTLVDQGGTVYEYWAEDASWHGYPSTLVFDACLNDWSSIQEMSSSVFSTITIGSVIGNSVDCGVLSPGDLVHWNGTVYRITEDSLKRGFTSSDVFNACGYDWDLITYLADEEYPLVTTLQDGSAISSTSDCSNIQGDLVHWEWTGTVYYLTGTGYKRGITSPEAMTSCGFDWNQVRYVSTNNGAVVWTLGDEAAITGNGDCP